MTADVYQYFLTENALSGVMLDVILEGKCTLLTLNIRSP